MFTNIAGTLGLYYRHCYQRMYWKAVFKLTYVPANTTAVLLVIIVTAVRRDVRR